MPNIIDSVANNITVLCEILGMALVCAIPTLATQVSTTYEIIKFCIINLNYTVLVCLKKYASLKDYNNAYTLLMNLNHNSIFAVNHKFQFQILC